MNPVHYYLFIIDVQIKSNSIIAIKIWEEIVEELIVLLKLWSLLLKLVEYTHNILFNTTTKRGNPVKLKPMLIYL